MNTVYAEGRPYAFIDWDMAGPCRPLDDVTYAAISFVAIRPDRFGPRPGCPSRPTAALAFGCSVMPTASRTDPRSSRPSKGSCARSSPKPSSSGRGVWPHHVLLARGEDRFRRMELAWLAANRPALDDAMR